MSDIFILATALTFAIASMMVATSGALARRKITAQKSGPHGL
jgi:hypothetical protein